MLSYQRFSRLWFLPISLWLLVLPFTASAQTDPNQVTISAQGRLQVLEVRVKQGDNVVAGDILAVMKQTDGGKLTLRAGASGVLREWKPSPYLYFEDKESLGVLEIQPLLIESGNTAPAITKEPTLSGMLKELRNSTGVTKIFQGQDLDWSEGIGRLLMILIGMGLLYLGINLSLIHI